MKVASVEVLEVRACVSCGAMSSDDDPAAAYVIGLKPPYGIRRCGQCGMRWQSPRPTPDALVSLYGTQYFSEVDSSGQFADYGPPPGGRRRYDHVAERRAKAYAEWHLRRVESLLGGPGSMLEIGVGRGVFLGTASERGWKAIGVEPSAQGVAAASSAGLDVVHGTLESFVAEERFDLVFAGHVLEHLEHPGAALEAMRALLSPDGLVVVEVPNQFEALGALISNMGRAILRRPRASSIFSIHHLSFFGESQLLACMNRAGLSATVQSVPAIAAEVPGLPKIGARTRLSEVGIRIGVAGDFLVGTGSAVSQPSPD